ncbi:MAG: DUF2270 domain-containing protein [Albidovulum sp.]
MTGRRSATDNSEFTPAEIGAIAHLYRAEVYRSTIWRTRLDTTTNWAVVTLGVALSITFAAPEASPLPLLLVGILILVFLTLEARRYRYFNVWRARSRWLERNFYAPMLESGDLRTETSWNLVLAEDYLHPTYHISFVTALGRRIRRNYLWILMIQGIAYVGKLMIHPLPVTSWSGFVSRADVGPMPGAVVLGFGVLYIGAGAVLANWVARSDARRAAERGGKGVAMG